MADFIKENISDGIDVLSVPVSQFKTNEISISVAVQLTEKTAALNAILPMLLCRSSEKYPDLTALNKKLALLYGAVLQPSVSKIGETQVLRMGITCIDDRFSLNSEKVSMECAKLLLSLLFEPRLDENGNFFSEDIEREKRILAEKIESEENEKRTYVVRRAEEAMFSGEPYAVNRYGTKKDVFEITKQDVLSAWENIIKTGKILLTVVGSADMKGISSLVRSCFENIERNFAPLPKAVFIPKADKVKELEERIDVKQGKLVLGFRVDMKPDNELTYAMRSFADIFGGGPYSRLFTKVREEMSLCYYCSARYIRQKSFILVQCGCEEENMEKAVSQILKQIDEIKNGNFDYEFKSSKIGLTDSINSVYDAPESLESWYVSQMNDNAFKSPLESAALNDSVTKEQIIECAKRLSLDTVYKLVSAEEGE